MRISPFIIVYGVVGTNDSHQFELLLNFDRLYYIPALHRVSISEGV